MNGPPPVDCACAMSWGLKRVGADRTSKELTGSSGSFTMPLVAVLPEIVASPQPALIPGDGEFGSQWHLLNTAYPDSGIVKDGLRVKDTTPADVTVSVFDVERHRYPHEDASFDVVLCLEVLEHLAVDPMAMMSEVNRVLKPGGTLVLSTPNAVRHSNVVKMILGEHPLGWTPYNGYDGNRHNREYTPSEIDQLFRAAGFTPSEVTTFGSKRRGLRRDLMKVVVATALTPFRNCPSRWRRDVILAVGTKTSPVRLRRPPWLYFDMAERVHTAPIGRSVPPPKAGRRTPASRSVSPNFKKTPARSSLRSARSS